MSIEPIFLYFPVLLTPLMINIFSISDSFNFDMGKSCCNHLTKEITSSYELSSCIFFGELSGIFLPRFKYASRLTGK